MRTPLLPALAAGLAWLLRYWHDLGLDLNRAPEWAGWFDQSRYIASARALARFLKLHPHNIAQKTEVMIEHFHAATQHKIGGRAKAMVITGSRLEAVRYKQSFDLYIQEKGYAIKSLVAFSGVVTDDKLEDVAYTEEGMNLGVREKELPEVFATQEYQVLLVAERRFGFHRFV